ncbi:MAG TPA: hypothetical protein VMX36_10285, partial [Sedimentisphaerales bacterium]|nr:hypothetical protein [Sedimentisphaerales bacterium]
CEATACGRGNLYPANGRDCFASLAMTKNTILYTRQAYVVPEKLATPGNLVFLVFDGLQFKIFVKNRKTLFRMVAVSSCITIAFAASYEFT